MTSLPVQHLGRLLALAMFLAALLSGGRDARADTAAAQALFDAAKQLMAQGKYADACPRLEESQRLDPGIGTQFNLAACYEQLGRTASAWSMFLEVAGASKAAGQLEREKVARQRAAALEPRLIRLTITAPGRLPGRPPGEARRRPRGARAVGHAGARGSREAHGRGLRRRPSAVREVRGAHPGGRLGDAGHPAAARGRAGARRRAPAERPPAPARAAAPPPSGATAPRGRRRAAGERRPVRAGRRACAGAPGCAADQAPQQGDDGPGIVLTSLGTVALLGGGLVLASSTSCSGDSCGYDSSSDPFADDMVYEESDTEGAGVGLVIGGLVLAGVGIPLAIIGGRKVPVQPEKRAASAPAPPPEPSSARATPGSAGPCEGRRRRGAHGRAPARRRGP